MRTIDFRGKRVDNGEWVYGYVDATMYKDIVVIHTETGTFGVDPETVGQFTGLHDKNGKPIYEGDMIGSQESNHYLEVRYIDGMFRLLDDVTGLGSIPAYYLMNKNNLVLEIVGNIYDNSKLLKGGEE